MVKSKTRRLIEDVFEQGDNRYIDQENAAILAEFIEGKAILIEKEVISGLAEPKDEDLNRVRGSQRFYEFIAKKELKEEALESKDMKWHSLAIDQILLQ